MAGCFGRELRRRFCTATTTSDCAMEKRFIGHCFAAAGLACLGVGANQFLLYSQLEHLKVVLDTKFAVLHANMDRIEAKTAALIILLTDIKKDQEGLRNDIKA